MPKKSGCLTKKLNLPAYFNHQEYPGQPTYMRVAPTLPAVAITNGNFQFTVTGTVPANYIVPRCTDLALANWFSPVTKAVLFIFTDTHVSLFSPRFYRAMD
jgi:hypothetical protein